VVRLSRASWSLGAGDRDFGRPDDREQKSQAQGPGPRGQGHYGIRELCDICPADQVGRCRSAHRAPSADQIYQVARVLPEAEGIQVADISGRAAVVSGLGDEQPRYYLQHALSFQMHDVRHPHHVHRHSRADIGWKDAPRDD
jgi:hypothetical protein